MGGEVEAMQMQWDVGRRSFKAAQPGCYYPTEQREPRIWGGTTPAPVSYLCSLVLHRDDVATVGQQLRTGKFRKKQRCN